MSVTFHVDLLVARRTAEKVAIDAAGATAAAKLRDSSGVLLSTLPLQYPCATVNGTTGQITFLVGARDDEAEAGGTAAKLQICDHAGKVCIEYSCAAGTEPVADTAVLPTLTIVAGAPVELTSFTIG